MRTRLAVLLILLVTTALGQSARRKAQPVAIAAEPLYKLVLENPRVRVLQAEIPAGKTTTFHRHEADYVLISLSPARVVERIAGKPARTANFAVGETQLVGGGLAHVLTNSGATPYRAVFVELLGAAGEPPPRTPGQRRNPCVYPAGGITDKCPGTFMQKRSWKGATVTVHQLAPGAVLGRHEHKSDHLAVAITPLHLQSAIEGQQPVHLTWQPGEVAWVQGGMSHSLSNEGQQPARFVTIELR